jgi:hypothetical protein
MAGLAFAAAYFVENRALRRLQSRRLELKWDT